MHTAPSTHRLAEVLPGAWNLGASNQIFWLDGRHGQPRFTFALVTPAPLRLSETIEFAARDGRPRTMTGTTRRVGEEFAWRGSGADSFLARRWSVPGVDDSGSIVVVRHRRTLSMPAGLSILVREGAEVGEVRREVACTAAALGVGPEDFASLTWMS